MPVFSLLAVFTFLWLIHKEIKGKDRNILLTEHSNNRRKRKEGGRYREKGEKKKGKYNRLEENICSKLDKGLIL